MNNSPLQLERYYVTSVHLDFDDTVQLKEVPPMQLEAAVGLAGHKDDARRWKVTLTVDFKPVDAAVIPYKGKISFIGHFAVDPSYKADRVRFLVETNGPSVLFGAVREMVVNLTARGPWSPLTLPTQSFYNPQAPAKPAEPKVEAGAEQGAARPAKPTSQ